MRIKSYEKKADDAAMAQAVAEAAKLGANPFLKFPLGMQSMGENFASCTGGDGGGGLKPTNLMQTF